MPATKTKPARSLSQFARDKKRSGCRVCSLPPDVRAEVRGASAKKIPRPVVIEWLRTEHGVTITGTDMAAHVNARHDSGDE